MSVWRDTAIAQRVVTAMWRWYEAQPMWPKYRASFEIEKVTR